MEFYRIQYVLKEYEDHIERENNEYEKQQKEAEKKYKTSSYGNDYKQPKLDLPKFTLPKL
jgi:hypothetical protein